MKRWIIDSTNAASIVETRRAVAQHVRCEAGGNTDDFMVELITGEVLAAEWYRHGGAVAVEVNWEQGDAVLDLWDQGPAIDLEAVEDPLDAPGNLLLRTFSDELKVERTEQGNHIRVALPAHKDRSRSRAYRFWEFASMLVGLRTTDDRER